MVEKTTQAGGDRMAEHPLKILEKVDPDLLQLVTG